MGKSYNLKAFSADIKNVLQSAGIAGEQSVLLLEDHQFLEPQFIEYVNSLLSAGEVPGLYAPEELDGLLMPIKEQAAADGFFGSLFDYFVSRVRSNLRVVMCMDPDNREFAGRCQSNPALYTRCSLQWWDAWSRDGAKYLPTVMLRDTLPSDAKAAARFIEQMLAIHESCLGRGGATPRTFIRLIQTYRKVYDAKCQASRKRQATLQAGL
jgi:dynein heavy chain 2